MAKKVTIRYSRESARLYDEVTVDVHRERGFTHKEVIGYRDSETGLIVGDIDKFEKWISKEDE